MHFRLFSGSTLSRHNDLVDEEVFRLPFELMCGGGSADVYKRDMEELPAVGQGSARRDGGCMEITIEN